MPSAPIPINEEARLTSLYKTHLLDSDKEPVFDHLTSLACQLLDVPIAAISLVDADREWFKSCQGSNVKESDRATAFCAYTILSQQPLIIPDATRDPRFANNPQVTKQGIRAYAGVPILGPDKEIIGAFCVKDIKPRSFSPAQIQHLQQLTEVCNFMLFTRLHQLQAEAASVAKNQFLANMSHEIRTPMTAILGFAEIIQEEVAEQGNDMLAQAAESICRNGKNLLAILDDILDISKIEAGKLSVESIEVAPDAIIHDVVDLFSPRATQAGILLQADTTHIEPVLLKSDPLRIRQILINLVSNAIKFTREGSVIIRASLDASPNQSTHKLRIDVADTGIGMSRDVINRLFNPFEQADKSTSRRFGGTGLGLSISRRMASLLGGEILVESEPNKGSVFSLILPVPTSHQPSIKATSNEFLAANI